MRLGLALLSLFAGLYSVPMHALVQRHSQPMHRGRIIAANNIWYALFLIVSAILAGAKRPPARALPRRLHPQERHVLTVKKGGILKILENTQRDGLHVPVVPVALTNL